MYEMRPTGQIERDRIRRRRIWRMLETPLAILLLLILISIVGWLVYT